MFKKDDVIICIDMGDNIALTNYKLYVVKSVDPNHVTIMENDMYLPGKYSSRRFILHSEYRSNIIDKILE